MQIARRVGRGKGKRKMLEFIGFIRRESSFVRLKQRTRIVLCARVLRSLIRRDIRHKERLDNRSIEVERVYSLETNNRVRRFVYIFLSLSLSLASFLISAKKWGGKKNTRRIMDVGRLRNYSPWPMKCLLEAGDKGLMQFQRLLPRTGTPLRTKFDLTLVLLTDREYNDTSRVTRHRYVMRVAINNRAPLVRGGVSWIRILDTCKTCEINAKIRAGI